MKMSKVDFEELKSRVLYEAQEWPSWKAAYFAAGHSAKRFRWDMVYRARVDVCALYGKGLNDDHIDTALRAIFG